MLLAILAVMFLLRKSDVMRSAHAPSRRTSLGEAEHHAARHITFRAAEHIARRVSFGTLGVCPRFYCCLWQISSSAVQQYADEAEICHSRDPSLPMAHAL